jgi:4-amino-4-deoxy-L-arabinose transferase-like glycosyltransferase
VALSILGLFFVCITTSRYGAGVSSDAVRALSTTEGLLTGKGFVDYVGSPYVLWPPLYPLVLAGISLVTGVDVFHAAWYLNLLLFPLNIWLWGIFFERIFAGKLRYALLASIIALFSSSMIRIYANVASDPLFVTFMVLFFLAAGRYLESASPRSLWSMFLLVGLAMLQRYLGVVLLGAAGLVVLSRRGWRGIPGIILPALLSVLPLSTWLLHNYLGFGTLFGGREYNKMWPLENISRSLTKMLHWFIPYAPWIKELLLRPWIVLLPLVILIVLLNVRQGERWRTWWRSLTGVHVWPALLSSLVYYLLLAFTVNTIDHRDLTSDRYYIILFPVILAFLLLSWDQLLAPYMNKGRIFQYVMLLAGLAWFVYPLYNLQEYLRLSLVNGEPSNYNIYNSRYFMELPVLKEGRRLAEAYPEAAIYSNYANLLWFQYKRPIRVSPADGQGPDQSARRADLRAKYAGWPGSESGFLIWFLPNEYKYLAEPKDLARIANLQLIYQDESGEIYRVSPR